MLLLSSSLGSPALTVRGHIPLVKPDRTTCIPVSLPMPKLRLPLRHKSFIAKYCQEGQCCKKQCHYVRLHSQHNLMKEKLWQVLLTLLSTFYKIKLLWVKNLQTILVKVWLTFMFFKRLIFSFSCLMSIYPIRVASV